MATDLLNGTPADQDRASLYGGTLADISKADDPNGPDVVARITTISLDADKEIVLPSGADLGRYRKNPIVMLNHNAYGKAGDYYPIPIGKALWIKTTGDALIAGIRFSRDTQMGREVHALFREEILRGFSIGFDELEKSPPSRAEREAYPGWANAKTIHRRWKLLEVSVVGLPNNEDALAQYVRKGHPVPSFLIVPEHIRQTSVASHTVVKGHEMIKHEGSKWVLYTHDGSRVLGRHDSKKEAEAQERAVQFFKHEKKGIGAHVKIDEKVGGGCGVIKSAHGEGMGFNDEEEDLTDGHRPAAVVEMHDASCKGTGVMKAFHHTHLTPIDGDANDHDADDEESAKKTFQVGDRVTFEREGARKFGRVKEIRVAEADADGLPMVAVEEIDQDGNAAEVHSHVSIKCLSATSKHFYGFPWEGPENESNDVYRQMAYGLIKRHAKLMHSGKAGHLYAHQAEMKAHMVRHPDDDHIERGFHSAEQCKAVLETAPHCKGVTIGPDHPDEAQGWERLHPPPEGYQRKILTETEAETKGLAEGSGTAGGYTTHAVGVTPGKEEPSAQTTREDSNVNTTEDPPEAYAPKPGHVVVWEAYHGMHAGCGEVASMHTKGRVPATLNEAHASEQEPHARVKLFKKSGDDDTEYERTDHHVAVRAKACKRMPILSVSTKGRTANDLPSKTASGSQSAKTKDSITPPKTRTDAPELTRIPKYRTEAQADAELRIKLRQMDNSPEARQAIAEETIAQLIGAVR